MNEFRSVSLDGLEVKAKGGRATIYILPEGRVLKAFDTDVSVEELQRNMHAASEAYAAGLPVARIHEIVNISGKYGLIYDYIDGQPISEIIRNNPERFRECVMAFSALSRRISNIQVKWDTSLTTNNFYAGALNRLRGILSDEEIDVYESAVDSVPRINKAVHGDYHLRNVMMNSAGQLYLIDLDDLSCGHPIWDISTLAAAYKLNPEVESDEDLIRYSGIGRQKCKMLWSMFTRDYFGNLPEDEVKRRIEASCTYALVRVLRMAADLYYPGCENIGHLGENNIRKNINLLRDKLDDSKKIFKSWR